MYYIYSPPNTHQVLFSLFVFFFVLDLMQSYISHSTRAHSTLMAECHIAKIFNKKNVFCKYYWIHTRLRVKINKQKQNVHNFNQIFAVIRLGKDFFSKPYTFLLTLFFFLSRSRLFVYLFIRLVA